MLLFPLLRYVFPGVYAPQQYLPHKETSASTFIFWFVDMFSQPLSVFATRGNMATIYAVFQIMMLTLFFVITIISLTVLIPVYYYGTDITYNTHYLTFWSKFTAPHLESGSLMNVVPIFVTVIVTACTMFLYHQFTMIYIFFRQRCMKRVIPQNFVVMITNIPSQINTKKMLNQVLSPIINGVQAIVPVPLYSNELTILYRKIQDQMGNLADSKILMQKFQTQYNKCQAKCEALAEELEVLNSQLGLGLTADDETKVRTRQLILQKLLKDYAKQADKSLESKNAEIQLFGDAIKETRRLQLRVSLTAANNNIHVRHLYNIQSIPPQLPQITAKAFDCLPKFEQVERPIRYPCQYNGSQISGINKMNVKSLMRYEMKQMQSRRGKYEPDQYNFSFDILDPVSLLDLPRQFVGYMAFKMKQQMINTEEGQKEIAWRSDGEETIGASAFLICQSQATAAEKYTSLIAQNSSLPEAQIAPAPGEIVWENMALSNRNKTFRSILSIVLLASVFVMYEVGLTSLMGLVTTTAQNWQTQFFNSFSPKSCTTNMNNIICQLCDELSNMLVSYIPNIIQSVIMSFLPTFIQWSINLRSLPSKSQTNDLNYQINFYYLIFLMGILQVAFPKLLDQNTGQFSISWLSNFNFNDFIGQMGENVVSYEFAFINYIINNYLMFPALGLLNLGGLWQWFKAWWAMKHGGGNSLKLNASIKFNNFDYGNNLSSEIYIFVIGYIYCIVAPVTNVVVFITYLMCVITDRYCILYMNLPDITADLSAQANILVSVISHIFLGLSFMLVATCVYFISQSGGIYTFGTVICILCFLVALMIKLSTDAKFKRGLCELARGKYEETSDITINPAFHAEIKSENDCFRNCYNTDDPEQWQQCVSYFDLEPKKVRYQRIRAGESKVVPNVIDYDVIFNKQCQSNPKHKYSYPDGTIFRISDKKIIFKPSRLDRFYAKFYINVVRLPVSIVQKLDQTSEETTCQLLEEWQIQDYNVGSTGKRRYKDSIWVENTQIKMKSKEMSKVTNKEDQDEASQLEELSAERPMDEKLKRMEQDRGQDEILKEVWRKQDEVNMMAYYTHPALVNTFFDLLKEQKVLESYSNTVRK